MKFALVSGGVITQYPYDLYSHYINTSFPVDLQQEHLPEGVVRVFEVTKPQNTLDTTVLDEGTPVFDGTKWVQVWNTRPATAEETTARTRIALAQAAKQVLPAEQVIVRLLDATPDQVRTYIGNRLGDLTTAQQRANLIEEIKIIAVVCSYLVKESFKENR